MISAARYYKKDWFPPLLLGLAFAVWVISNATLLQKLELLVYDSGMRLTSRAPGASENIAIVAIDDHSLEEIGPWPWPRSILAEAVEQLVRAKAKVIALLVPLDEPQTEPGLAYVKSLVSYLEANPLPKTLKQRQEISRLLAEAEHQLDTDFRLAQSMPSTGQVFLPMRLVPGNTIGKPEVRLPEHIRHNRLTQVTAPADSPGTAETTIAARVPLDMLARKSAGIGHFNFESASANGTRSEALVFEHYGDYYPSLSLLLAAYSLNISPSKVQIELGKGVRIGHLDIQTDKKMRMYPAFYRARHGENPFPIYSFQDVRAARIPAALLKNKIVLLGPTASGIGGIYPTPLGSMSGTEVTANVVTSILNQDFYSRARWAPWVEGFAFAAVLLYLMFVLPRLSPRFATPLSAALMVGLLVAGLYLLLSEKLWLKTATPALFLLVGHILATVKRLAVASRHDSQARIDSTQTTRMLGLAFQSQGQLDMALDKFRKLPMDNSILELFFNLALDFERKRQFNKAAACYDHILQQDPKFRDVAERKQRAIAAGQAVILGGTSTKTSTLVLEASERPRLGRYEIEKELGRGAMGTVYLGRDPRINRVVAIKTVVLSQFEETELAQIRERFFREAETAGRLNHPNIVTIYDAGEEDDIGYIAMEFLEGNDLAHYLQGAEQPEFDWVIEVGVQVANALDYAHRHDVVHRDIKPANIMYEEASKTVKVTDFGIARISASTRTKTGAILGSPSYMSPEQLAGKRVDGRSDIFSLGVTLFELLTGKPPFQGDSMATLMFQIANEPHPDILALRPDLPPRVRTTINKALQKDPAKRFQTAAELREALLKNLRVAS